MKPFRAFLTNKKYLTLSVVALLTAFLLLLYFQRNQISGLIQTPPKTYSLVTFNPKSPRSVLPGDILTGRAIPDSNISIFLAKEQGTKIKADSKGNWSYQIPKNISSGSYILTTLILDKLNNISAVKTYRLQISENKSLIPKFKINNPFQAKNVQAQGTYYDFERLIGPNWASWLALMQSMDIYPAWEGGNDVVLYNKQTYSDRYCGGRACSFSPRAITDWTKEFDEDITFFAEVVNAAMLQCYAITALESYFPDINNRLDTRLNRYKIGIPCINGHKDTIDQQTLESLINQVAIEKGFLERDVFKGVVMALDPFTGSRSLYNVVTGYQLTNTEDKINAFFAVLSLVPYARSGSQLLTKGISYGLDMTKTVRDVSMFKAAIKEGTTLPLSVVASRAGSWVRIEASPFTNQLFSKGFTLIKDYDLVPKLLQKATENESTFLRRAQYLILKKEAYVVQQDVSSRVLEHLISGLKSLEKYGLIKIEKEKAFETIYDNWIIMYPADESVFFKSSGEIEAFAAGRAIIIKENNANLSEIADTLTHEFIHTISSRNRTYGFVGSPITGKYFSYSRDQASTYGSVMSQIYEISTDQLTEYISGGISRNGYKAAYPELYNSIQTLVETLIQRSKGSVSWIDFYNFALTADDNKLMEKILSKMKIDEFLSLIDETIEVDILKKIVMDYETKTFNKRVVVGTGGAAIVLFTLFTANAEGRELPPDTTFLYETPTFDQDVNLLKEPINYGINIIGFTGSPIPDSTLETSAVIYLNGQAVSPEGFYKSWAIKKVDDNEEVKTLDEAKLLQGGEKCKDDCQVILPADITPGEYKLIVYLTKGENKFILASNTFPVTIDEPKTEITSITFGDQTIPVDSLDIDFPFSLPGTEEEEGSFEIPLTINLSNNTTRNMVISFSYVIPRPCPEPYPQCGGTPGLEDKDPTHAYLVTPICNDLGVVIDYEKKDEQESVECGGTSDIAAPEPSSEPNPDSNPEPPSETTPEPPTEPNSQPEPPPTVTCPEPYPQCGGTTGLEGYPATDTIWVTPVCNDRGDIIDYQKDNLGDRGECQQQEQPQQGEQPQGGSCDDLYYYDTAYETCVHKYSNDPYPNCYYLFDSVDNSFCP